MAELVETMTQKIITNRVKEVVGKERVLEFIGTTEMPDRDGEVIKADAWQVDRYTQNPVVQWAHQYNQPPIGRTLSIRQNKKKETIFEIEFAERETYEFADTIFKLCKEGYLNATSVGFIPIEYERGKKESEASRIFTKVELLEISIVPVPSNPEALVTARNAGLITTKEFEFVTKPEETEEYIRIPVKECKITATIDISAKEGIQALYCGKEKEIATYLFAKAKGWTMEKAKKWIEEHKKSGEPRGISQSEIKDEIDYLITMIDESGLSDESKKSAQELVKRITGSDIPDKDIKQTIRSMVRPVIKALSAHDIAHQECFKLCKETLEEIGKLDNMPAQNAFTEAIDKAIEEAIRKNGG